MNLIQIQMLGPTTLLYDQETISSLMLLDQNLVTLSRLIHANWNVILM